MRALFDRLFGYLACMVPGSVVFLLVLFHRPDLVLAVWQNQVLTYEAKILLTLFFSFAFGFSATFFFGSLLGGLGGGIGEFFGPIKFPDEAPWHKKEWRSFLGNYLGQRAPADIDPPLSRELFTQRLESIKRLPTQEAALQELEGLRQQEDQAYRNENEWFAWWYRFHLKSFSAQDPIGRMYETVSNSFYVAAFIALIGGMFTPQLRLWWVLVICLAWLVHFAITLASILTKARDPFGSYQDQIGFFQEQLEREKRIDKLEESL